MMTDRRRLPRRVPDRDEPLARVRLRTGRQLDVIDVSDSGMLVEGEMRLLPGTHVDVHVVTGEGRQLVRSRIARAFVSHVAAELIRYRGVLTFERSIDTAPMGYHVPDMLAPVIPSEGSAYPATASMSIAVDDERAPIVSC